MSWLSDDILGKKLREMEDMLIWMLLNSYQPDLELRPDIASWWKAVQERRALEEQERLEKEERHKRFIERETMRLRALEKLTAEERELFE